MSASYDLMNKFGAITLRSSCAQSHSRSMVIGRQNSGGVAFAGFQKLFTPAILG